MHSNLPVFCFQITDKTTSLTVRDSSREHSGTYAIRVKNAAGERSVSINVRVLDTPGSCQQLTVSGVTGEKCTLSWQPPLLDGGSRISGYSIQKRETSRLAWTNVAENLETNHHKVCMTLCFLYFQI